MEIMRHTPNKAYDLAIVDPPYGIRATAMKLGEGGGLYRKPKKYKRGEWDNQAPPIEYFTELRRISKHQIIWGANHFIDRIPIPSSCWVFWDKNNGDTDFADGELAWTSFKIPVRKFKFTWSGFIQGKMGDQKEERIHPTQKPIELYWWLLDRFAKPGDKVIDTHLGSGSSAIAAHRMGYDFTGIELDATYFEQSVSRFKLHTSQQALFT